MPFLSDARKKLIDNTPVGALDPSDVQELTYALHKIVKRFLGATMTHQKVNLALGAIENVKHEFYRKDVAPFNNQEKHDNEF